MVVDTAIDKNACEEGIDDVRATTDGVRNGGLELAADGIAVLGPAAVIGTMEVLLVGPREGTIMEEGLLEGRPKDM